MNCNFYITMAHFILHIVSFSDLLLFSLSGSTDLCQITDDSVAMEG